MHEEWTDRLSEYLDGELPDADRRAVEAHLQRCADCSAVLGDLRRVVARAQEMGATVPRPPSVDLWDGIVARIESRRSAGTPSKGVEVEAERSAGSAAPFTPRVGRRLTFTLPQLAAAAVVVAAVSGGLVWSVSRRPEGLRRPSAQDVAQGTSPASGSASQDGAAETESAEPHAVPVAMADAQYDAAVSDLEKALKQGRGKLDASTIAIVEHNLQIIDQAIDQAREALATDPANTYLSSHLVEARRRKLDLLRRAAALSETN